MKYHSASDGLTKDRSLGIYHLLPYEQTWQAIAHDSLRGEVRMFKLDRIDACELTEESYTIPADFDVATYLGTNWGVLRGEDSLPEDVELRFSPLAAAWARDRVWHPSQRAEVADDGGIVLQFRCGVTHEFVRWVLGFGGEVCAVRPTSLIDRVLGEAKRVIEGHSAPGDEGGEPRC